MADPLSIVASVIAIVEAARQVSKLGKELYSLRKAPGNLLAALNEVEDTVLVLTTVEDSLRVITEENDREPPAIRNGLNRVNAIACRFRGHLEELHELIEERFVVDQAGSSALTQVRKAAKRAWPKVSDQLDRLREEMRQCRNNLICALSALGNMQHHRTRLDIKHLSFQIAQLTILGRRNPGKEFLLRNSPMNTIEGFLEVDAIGAEPPCLGTCSCKCHTQSLISTPLWLQGALGALFCNYAAIPIFQSKQCTNQDCKKREKPSIQFTYFFPGWALSRALLLSASAEQISGWGASLSIRMPKLTPENSLGWQMVRSGDLQAIQQLFNQGLASTVDVDSHGRSFLHEAVFRLEVDICRYLISKGARFNYQDNDGWSPADSICQQFFIHADESDTSRQDIEKKKAIIRMKALLNVQDTLDRWGLTPIHRIVLGLDEGTLEEHLRLYHELRDRADWQGRTPLHWAAARGNADIIRMLLKYKVKTSAVDIDGVTPLHLAANYSSTCCVDLLLGAGADPNAVSHYHSTPFHFAVRTRVPTIPNLRALAQHGGDLEIRDKYGQTVLLFALQNHSLDAVAELIRLGADIEAENALGETVIHYCVKLCLPTMIRLLRERGAKMNRKIGTGNTVIHLAAKFADIEAMHALAEAPIHDLHPLAQNADGKSVDDIFNERFDQNPSPEDIRRAFTELINSVLSHGEGDRDIFFDSLEEIQE